MVFCRECKRKVEDCEHFVAPLQVKPVEVYDPKVKTLAYEETRCILEITFKNGQTWQLSRVAPDIYQALLDQTLSSFLKFLAHRYTARPVRAKTGSVPTSEPCPECKQPMKVRHQTSPIAPARVLWHCERCPHSVWRSYGVESVRERKTRWH